MRLLISALGSTIAIGLGTFAAGAPARVDDGPERADAAGKPGKLRLKQTRFGRVIHDTRTGLAAYAFTRDRPRKSRCYGECAEVWPPWKADRKPRAGNGIKRRRIRMVRRRGGAKQVTYKGRPLYFYVHDSPGVILCHDVFEFGGDWLLIKRSGKPA
jgi:predicted lipoprotein with Yx(FWY)xxD motif